jgi:hypothetical protein
VLNQSLCIGPYSRSLPAVCFGALLTTLSGRTSHSVTPISRLRSEGGTERSFSCLHALGLRVGDTVQLRLGDLDWREGMICVSGKGRRQAVVPLTQQVGDALATYIKDHRPRPTPMQCLSGHSLRIEPSVTPLPSVSAIVARAMRRVGINCSRETRSSSYPPSLCGQQYVAAGVSCKISLACSVTVPS